MPTPSPIVTVALHTAIDRIIESKGFVAGATQRGRLLGIQPAGKAINVSCVLGALGVRSIATGFAGSDEIDVFEGYMTSAGGGLIVPQLLPLAGKTRENITIVDPERGHETHIRMHGAVVRGEDVERIERKVMLLARPGSYVVFSGSLPPGLDPQWFAAVLGRLARRGAQTVVDTSGDGLEAAAAERLWLLKINEHELRDLVSGGDGAILDLGQRLHAERSGAIEHLLVTIGRDGVLLFTSEGVWRARTSVDPAAVVNTVGSGDALLAGVLARLSSGADWPSALRAGVGAASANVVSRITGQVDRADVEQYASSTSVERVR
jgi:1-phosphofructokinase family hexose kinase